MENPNRGERARPRARPNAGQRGELGNRQANGAPNWERRGGGGGGAGRGGGRGRGRGGAGRGAAGGRGGGPMRDAAFNRDHHQQNRRPEDQAQRGDGGDGAQRGRGGRDGVRGRGAGAGRGTGRDGTPRKIGFKYLEGLMEKEASEVAITLSTNAALQVLLEEKTMSHDLVQLLCEILCKAFQSKHDRKTVQHLAGVVKDSGFLLSILPHYVTGMMSEHLPARRERYPQNLDTIISLLNSVVSIYPSSSVRAVSTLVFLLKPAINQLRATGLDILEETEESLEKVQELVSHLQEKAREGTLRSDNYSFLGAEEDAPPGEEDFRTMSIYPTPEEFHEDEKPFLRPNMTSQRYPSTHVYLDTHFRLLREDFVRPLREGIQQLLKSQADPSLEGTPMAKRRFDDIRIYFDTRLVVPLCTPTGVAYKVQFDPRPLKFVRWQNSKRLIYGSLVCLSMDNFETFLFATVTDRKVEALQQGQVLLSFCRHSRPALARVRPSDSFLMVETEAYFEAYRYVLEGLQEQQVEDLPFQRYIVECNPDIHPPAYLLAEPRQYDLSNILAEGFKGSVRPFNPLKADAWPSEEQLGLDESQIRALKLALTKELAIIQGPPGTGKTHVGLKIAHALLDNHLAWGYGSPMLVVCYTNHALDQFLEGIHKFLEKGIVRVGGRSNSEVLKPFALRELTRSSRRELPHHLRRAKFEIHKELEEAEQLIKRQAAQLECSLRGVIQEQFLERYISDVHWDSLCVQPFADGFQSIGKKPSMILEWLGFGTAHFQYRPNGNHDEEEEDDDGAEPTEVDLIEVDEVADLMQAERILDDAIHGDRDREQERQRQRRMDEENLEELAQLMLAMNVGRTQAEEEQQQQPPGQSQAGEEWEMQKQQKRKLKQRMRGELKKSSAMTDAEEARVTNIWTLPPKEKWKLYRLWIHRFQTEQRARVLQSEQVYQDAAERLSEIRMREDMCVLRNAKVIGMTTTGAARYRQVLQEVRPRLVIVEEAAEVLEAHTITTLSRACQHLILIGDHQQLRPSATVFELARNFNLEVSMFERLVTVDFPYVRLNYQHRMCPEIARLLTPHIYAELENHPSVLDYENVKGVLTNLFFVEHEQREEQIKDGRSHQNMHEAAFVVALCRYLLHQGYEPSQITILTTYTGQLYCLRKLMPAQEYAGVKVHVVDKYQGEENDIVILSLVRSNREGRVGFLSIPNRVCVALSRAKRGLYCLGDMGMLSRVKLWSAILHTLREHGQVGKALTLSCQNHPERRTLVAGASDFAGVPEGGCSLPCEFRLACGHVCTRACHPYDAEHKKFRCVKDCARVLCPLGHRCPRLCYQTCRECVVPVPKVIPRCQHEQMVPCHQDAGDFVCQVPCEKRLRCGHVCEAKCGESCTERCTAKVTMTLKCGHAQKVHCYQEREPDEPSCQTKCGATLKCGHPCPGTCHTCKRGRLHRPCNKKCQHVLVCSHQCHEPCTRDCPPCGRPCQNRCVHSVCRRTCGQPCAPCAEPCAWSCPHHRCGKLCHEPCDRPPCNEPCDKRLPGCGHPCIGLCGDPCPTKCRVCHPDEVSEIFFGTEDEPDARFVQLEHCRHLFEVTSMDTYMAQDEDQKAGLDQLVIKLKECPKCRAPIRRNLRYGAHTNRSLAQIEQVKEKINGNPDDIKRKQDALKVLLGEQRNLKEFLPEEYGPIRRKLEDSVLSLRELCHQENRVMFLERLGKLLKAQKERMSGVPAEVFSLRLGQCLRFLEDRGQRFSEQQVWDLERELQRLSFLAELNSRCGMTGSMPLTVRVKEEVDAVRQVLEDTGPFTEADEDRVKRALADLDGKLPRGGLGIDDQERVMIVRAMALPRGHWYKCPNGHVYAIGDCGGATVSRRCPDCNALIGGANHNLNTGNEVASEMDGAQHAAWSDAANLANFHLDEL